MTLKIYYPLRSILNNDIVQFGIAPDLVLLYFKIYLDNLKNAAL